MNANTALKINDAIDQAIRCGESVEAVKAQVSAALTQAVRTHRKYSVVTVRALVDERSGFEDAVRDVFKDALQHGGPLAGYVDVEITST